MEDVELADAARALWEAPFAVLAHDKFLSPEPAFTYANQARPQALNSNPPACTSWSGWAPLESRPQRVLAIRHPSMPSVSSRNVNTTRRASLHVMANARSCKRLALAQLTVP